jgi:hypothetical protein
MSDRKAGIICGMTANTSVLILFAPLAFKNLRSASILGLIGAGGIGTPLIFAIQTRSWDRVGIILIGKSTIATISTKPINIIPTRSQERV